MAHINLRSHRAKTLDIELAAIKVTGADEWYTALTFLARLNHAVVNLVAVPYQFRQTNHIPSFWIRCRLTEHVDEYRLGQLLRLGEGFAALGSEGIDMVENRCDSTLFGEGREGDRN